MSIINAMLQDLDKRHGRPAGEAAGSDAVRSTRRESRWRLRRDFVVTLLGLALGSGAAAWWLQQRTTGPAAVIAAPSPVVVHASPPLPSPAGSMPATSATPISTTTISATSETPSAGAQSVASAASAAAVRAGSTAVPQPMVPSASLPSHAVALGPLTLAPTQQAKTPNAIAARDTASTDSAPSESTPPPPKAAAASAPSTGAKTYSAAQRSANLVAEALALDQHGQQDEARTMLQRTLAGNPQDVLARQLLVRLQMESGRVDEARTLLAEGLRLHPERADFAVTLARLQAEAGDGAGAITLLEAGQAAAGNEPQYHALLATLLLQDRRFDEAVQHYLVALRSDPANLRWLVGTGAALEGLGRSAEAAQAYRRAAETPRIAPELANFLGDRLARLSVLERGAESQASGTTRTARTP